MRRFPVLGFTLMVLIGAGAGFAASHLLETRAVEQLKADLNDARDCRRTAATLPPCPVTYKSTRIEWHDRIKTVETPDSKQAARIAALSAELTESKDRIRELEQRRTWRAAPRFEAAYWLQNGTIAHPYSTGERCPAGMVVVYEAPGGPANRRLGDPNVCYVASLKSVAEFSPERR